MKNLKKITISLVTILLIGLATFQWYTLRSQSLMTGKNYSPAADAVYDQRDSFLYQGREGVDALTLLKQKTRIKQNETGLVIAINGRQADTVKREFWAFYINGTMAQVGPKAYVTRKGDVLLWKIDHF